jgi:RNA polymerase sigma factor (sigma-70 family)
MYNNDTPVFQQLSSNRNDQDNPADVADGAEVAESEKPEREESALQSDPFHCVNIFKTEVAAAAPVLSAEAEAHLFQQLSSNRNDQEAEAIRQQLITSLLPTAIQQAQKFQSSLGLEDAISIANLVAVQTVDSLIGKYDPTRGRLASVYIQQVRIALSKHSAISDLAVSIPSEVQDNHHKIKKALTVIHQHPRTAFTKAKSADPSLSAAFSVEELANLAALPPATVAATLRAFQMPLRFDQAVKDQDGEPTSAYDYFSNPSAETPEHAYGRVEGHAVLKAILSQVLTPKQYMLVDLLYLADPAYSLPQAAKLLGISPSTLKGRRQQALARLRTIPGLKALLHALVAPFRIAGKLHPEILTLPPSSEAERLRHQAGTRHACKLSPLDRAEIKTLRAAGIRNKDLAKRYNVCPATISYTCTLSRAKSSVSATDS